MIGRLCAGAIALLIAVLTASHSFAQAQGQVEGIGYQNTYRPDCWTPLIVSLRPETSKSDRYQIQVKQEDLDRDHPIFSRLISVTGNTEGAVRDQKFRTYFKPQPTSNGLGDNVADLQDLLQASLCTSGGKWLASLPLTMQNIQDVDMRTPQDERHIGTRLVLAVADGSSGPNWNEYKSAWGDLEKVTMVTIHPADMPESVLGYDAIDAVVWLNADPADLKLGTDEKFRALESYVRRGGTLVICTPTDWQKMSSFGDLLPVTIQGNKSTRDPDPLRRIARKNPTLLGLPESTKDGWDNLDGEYFLAQATAKPGARVVDLANFPDSKDGVPWLVRRPFGAGVVTWVAQDLTSRAIARTLNWPRIWDYVLDLRNKSFVPAVDTSSTITDIARPSNAVDLGTSLLEGMELSGKSAGLIFLAVVFFIAYWILAGPGVYAYLVAKKRATMSWFAFAASALVATAVTVLVVKLTLRGAPEMKHMSLVRAVSGEPAIVYSRFGLYIPRDGVQQIELKDTEPGSLATLSAFAIHPQLLDNSAVPQDPGPEYEVMVRDSESQEPATIRVPYRTTLKKFDADWTGALTGRVEGAGKLRENGEIQGTLTNGTGLKLRNVYIAYFQPQPGRENGGDDLILYIPSWDPGQSLDLDKRFQPRTETGGRVNVNFYPRDNAPTPGRNLEFRGYMRDYWQPYWTSQVKPSAITMGDAQYNDYGSRSGARTSIPMLSFFSRLAPVVNERASNNQTRYEILRRGARRYDVSSALSAGSLVVVAEAPEDVPIPIPLEVEGDRITGTGSTVYQFILPLDSSAIVPTTEPSP